MSKIVKIENITKSKGKFMTSLVVTTPEYIWVFRAMVDQKTITTRVWKDDNCIEKNINDNLVSAIALECPVPNISLDWSRINQKYVWSVVV